MVGTVANCPWAVAFLCSALGVALWEGWMGVAIFSDVLEGAWNLDFVENLPSLKCGRFILKPATSQMKHCLQTVDHQLMTFWCYNETFKYSLRKSMWWMSCHTVNHLDSRNTKFRLHVRPCAGAEQTYSRSQNRPSEDCTHFVKL